jgi:hypothetical protein
MRHLRNFSFLLVTVLALAGCNLDQLLPRADFDLSLSPRTQIDVLMRTSGGVITYDPVNVQLAASARPGSLGASVKSMSIKYYYADGTPVYATTNAAGATIYDDTKVFKVPVFMPVPGGFDCVATVNCSINSPDFYQTQGPGVVSIPFDAINQADAKIINDSGKAAGAYADLELQGEDSNGNPYRQVLTGVSIIFTQ